MAKPQLDPELPTDHLSFALGVALGRFGANGEGIFNPDLEPRRLIPTLRSKGKWELRLQQEIGPGNGGDVEHRANYLATNGEEALQTIEAEALRCRKKLKQPQVNLTILEPGLWTTIPELCWAMELRVIIKQGGVVSLLAPRRTSGPQILRKGTPRSRRGEEVRRQLRLTPTRLHNKAWGRRVNGAPQAVSPDRWSRAGPQSASDSALPSSHK